MSPLKIPDPYSRRYKECNLYCSLLLEHSNLCKSHSERLDNILKIQKMNASAEKLSTYCYIVGIFQIRNLVTIVTILKNIRFKLGHVFGLTYIAKLGNLCCQVGEC